MKPYIEFKKQRDLGEILSDTFAFIRNEFKPFFSTFLRIVGPFLAVMLVCYGFYMYKVGDFFVFAAERVSEISDGWVVGLILLAFAASALITYALAVAVTLFYIKSYANNKGSTKFDDIKRQSYASLGQFVGLFFLVGLCVGIGFVFCILPGVYLYVPLSLSFSILVFNKETVSDAFSSSFKLVKDYWWNTFACLFVVGIIVTVASYAFALPAQIYSLVRLGVLSGEVDAENFTLVDSVSILLGIFSTLARFLLNIISIIASVFIYFDLNEKKNFTGTYERINNLGGAAD